MTGRADAPAAAAADAADASVPAAAAAAVLARYPRGPRTRGGRWAARRRVPRAVRIALLLAPAGGLVAVLFGGGLLEGVLQSLGYLPFLPGWHWSTAAYRTALHDPAVRRSVLLTVRLAGTATAVAAVLGVAAALLIRATRVGQRALTLVFQSTLPVPHLVGALCMTLLLGQTGFAARLGHAAHLVGRPESFPVLTNDGVGWGILAEYVWKETPFIGLVVLSTLSGGIAELEDAARLLGARRWQRFRRVTLPLITPAVAASSILVFAFAASSYEVPYLLGRTFPATLPVVAFQYFNDVDLQARPEAMAIAVLVAAGTATLVVAYLWVTERALRRAR